MGILESIATVMVELWENRKRLFRLAKYEMKNKQGGTALGFLWNFLNPALQVLVYWFIFSIGLKKGADVNGVPYVIWLVIGIVCWNFISPTMSSSEISIVSSSDILKRMKFPMSIIPAKTVMSNFIIHVCTMGIVLVVVLISEGNISSSIWILPYYMFANAFFVLSYSLFAATINVLFRDFHNLSNTALRLLFYISPVMWRPDKDNTIMNAIAKVNPFAYILNGYRDSILYEWSLSDSLQSGLIFWSISITLFILGCVLHMRLRNKFIDSL